MKRDEKKKIGHLFVPQDWAWSVPQFNFFFFFCSRPPSYRTNPGSRRFLAQFWPHHHPQAVPVGVRSLLNSKMLGWLPPPCILILHKPCICCPSFCQMSCEPPLECRGRGAQSGERVFVIAHVPCFGVISVHPHAIFY